MSEVVTRVLPPWVGLRLLFARFSLVLNSALGGPVPLMHDKMARAHVEDVKKFFERLAVYVEALSRASQPNLVKPAQVPSDTEYDDVKDFLYDFASSESSSRFYNKETSLAIVALLGEALITGMLTVETAEQLLPLAKSILVKAEEMTSSSFDEAQL